MPRDRWRDPSHDEHRCGLVVLEGDDHGLKPVDHLPRIRNVESADSHQNPTVPILSEWIRPAVEEQSQARLDLAVALVGGIDPLLGPQTASSVSSNYSWS